MRKIIAKYGADNCTSPLVQGTYSTGFNLLDFETMSAIGDSWLPKDLFRRLLSHDLSTKFTVDEKNHITNLLIDIMPNKQFPFIDIDYHPHRVLAASLIIKHIPKGLKDGGSSIYSGFSGLGKTTATLQTAGNIFQNLKDYKTKEGAYMTKIHYYITEKNAIDKSRFRELTRMTDEEYANGVEVGGAADNSTDDFVSYILNIRNEKLDNQMNLVTDVMCVDGKVRKTLAPTIVVCDSLSAMRVGKYADKMEKEFEKGKDGNKESDIMRALQAKATMLSTTNLFKYCEEANIIILFIVHIGQDQGISIGYQNVQIKTGLNDKTAHKTKGVPANIKYLMDGIFDLSGMDADMAGLNDLYGRPDNDLRFVARMLIGKNRGGEVYKGKSIPMVFTSAGQFDNSISTFYYYHKELGKFDYSTARIDGIYKEYAQGGMPSEGSELLKFTKGKVTDTMIFNSPISNMIIANNLFRDIYLEKMYKSEAVEARQAVNNLLTGSSDGLLDMFKNFNLSMPIMEIDEDIQVKEVA